VNLNLRYVIKTILRTLTPSYPKLALKVSLAGCGRSAEQLQTGRHGFARINADLKNHHVYSEENPHSFHSFSQFHISEVTWFGNFNPS
jgi:hypothetical protein